MKTAAKDFKMTELGPIPKDWEVKRLGDLSSVITKGTTPTSIGCDYVNSGINFIKAESITDEGLFLPEMFAHIDDETNHLLGRSQLERGDYLFSIAGVLGRVACVQDDVLPANTNQALAIIRLSSGKDLDRRFIFYSLKAKPVEDYISNVNVAAAQANLSLENVADLPMVLPPLPEQRKIAAALSDVDEMIAALEKLIEKKRKIKTGAMQRLLTAKTRLPGFKGAWVEKRLGDCAEVFCDGDWIESADQSDVGIRLVQTGNVGEGVFLDKADKKRFISEATFKRLNCCEIFAGDVLVSRLPDPAGRACRLPPSSERRITAVDCTIIRFNDLLAAEYFVAFSQTAGYYKQIDEQMAGSTRQRISRKALGDVVVSCPPTLAEQKAIAKVLGDMDEEIAALEAELAKTRQLKQGMMQELLTGKVRLV